MRTYGPVPSRRFGLSLGVDLVPRKACSFDCIYCQVGPTTRLEAVPCDFFSVDEIVGDVVEALEEGPTPDVITFAGSGEPTLYRSLGPLIDRIRTQTDIPILLITNSSMLWNEDVAKAVMKVDILAPSLDAGDAKTYEKLNRSVPGITFEKVIAGLATVTHQFHGEIRLEVMLVRGVNDSDESLRAVAAQLERMRFDRLDVNTPVRPPRPERGALPSFQDTLVRALEIFGPKAQSIGKFAPREDMERSKVRRFFDIDKDIRETLLRRPSTPDDIAAALGLPREQVLDSIGRLVASGLVAPAVGGDEPGDYYHVPSNPGNRQIGG